MVVVALGGAALLVPSIAAAHVGKKLPVASNFRVTIDKARGGTSRLQAAAVDGDQSLWLSVPPANRVIVLGVQREPLLLFDQAGVYVNLRSLTAQVDGIDKRELKPPSTTYARPLWRRIRSGHSFLWHEHRLHVGEAAAREMKSSATRWSIPLIVNGRSTALSGSLVYSAPPSIWPLAVLAAALAVVGTAMLVLDPIRSARAAVGAALIATLLIWAVRIARDLYGRPMVGFDAWVDVVFSSLVGLALLCGLAARTRDVRVFTTMLVGFGCLGEGWTMLRVLDHSHVLTELPASAARFVEAATLGLGVGVLAITLRELFRVSERELRTQEPQERRHQPTNSLARDATA